MFPGCVPHWNASRRCMSACTVRQADNSRIVFVFDSAENPVVDCCYRFTVTLQGAFMKVRLKFALLVLVMCILPATFVGQVAAQGESVPVIELNPQYAVDWMNLLYRR